MKALVLEAADQPPVLREVPTPEPGPGEARVAIEAAALNRRDVWIGRGKYPGIVHPIIPGSDGYGVVDAVGAGVDAAWLGQRVIINPSINWGPNPAFQGPDYEILGLPRNGTFAEAVVVPAANLHAAPAHLTPAGAAALPLAGLTAWRALITRGGVQAGERVLVTGAGGGVSQFAMQFALAHGATVAVTSSRAPKIAAAVSAGAVGGVDYTQPGWHRAAGALVSGGLYDVIIDSAGGPGFGALVRLLAPGGRLAFYGGTAGRWPEILPQHLFFKQVSIFASTMGSPQDFAAMVAFVAAQQIEPTVDRVFPLAEGPAAFAHLEAGAQLGKVVLSVG